MAVINFYNEDCLKAMKSMPNNKYDLAIVDPPYGIDVANDSRNGKKMRKSAKRRTDYAKKDWDKEVPTLEYFQQLFRVSKEQIIWGVNYYPYSIFSGGRIYWNKDTAEDYSNSDGELAYCSMINSIRSFKSRWNGMLQHDMKNKEIRIHPTQKPVRLYEWLLINFARFNYKVLDTHGGSHSIAIACHNQNIDLDIYEIDKQYHDDGVKRFKTVTAQQTLF